MENKRVCDQGSDGCSSSPCCCCETSFNCVCDQGSDEEKHARAPRAHRSWPPKPSASDSCYLIAEENNIMQRVLPSHQQSVAYGPDIANITAAVCRFRRSRRRRNAKSSKWLQIAPFFRSTFQYEHANERFVEPSSSKQQDLHANRDPATPQYYCGTDAEYKEARLDLDRSRSAPRIRSIDARRNQLLRGQWQKKTSRRRRSKRGEGKEEKEKKRRKMGFLAEIRGWRRR